MGHQALVSRGHGLVRTRVIPLPPFLVLSLILEVEFILERCSLKVAGFAEKCLLLVWQDLLILAIACLLRKMIMKLHYQKWRNILKLHKNIEQDYLIIFFSNQAVALV